MMELLILFDRDDRLYRFGEVISGKVVLEAGYDRTYLEAGFDSTYSELWITYRWRTHGKGERDQGEEQRLTLAAEKMSFKAGERREFPFHFAAPNGPVTYHGHLLNVDWYLAAHARSGPFSGLTSEQDFLLQAGDPTGPLALGTKEIPRADLPASSAEEATRSYDSLEVKSGVAWLFVTLFVTLLILSAASLIVFLDWSPLWAFITSGATLVLLAALLENAYKRKLKLKLGEVWVRPASVYGGSEVYCHVDFVARRGCRLHSIKASISARERITRTVGTTTGKETHLLNQKTYTKPFDEDLPEGRSVTFDCALPVGPDAPASFSSTNNALEWTVTMKAELKGWANWRETFPITVLPWTFADKQDHSVDDRAMKRNPRPEQRAS